MSIQNFPKIPKITLIKPCDQAKDTKNQKYTFLNTIYWIFDDFVVLLRGATLKYFDDFFNQLFRQKHCSRVQIVSAPTP